MNTTSHPEPLARALYTASLTLAITAVLLLVPAAAQAQIYVSGGNVSAYDATTGTATPGFTPTGGLSGPVRLALSGNNLFVSSPNTITVDEYNATTGALINNTFITEGGIDGWNTFGLAVSGNVHLRCEPGRRFIHQRLG